MTKNTSPLTADEIAGYQRQMHTRLGELTSRLSKIEDHLDEAPEQDWEDAAQNAENDEVLEGLGNSGLREIDTIKAALARIDNGTYGKCARSGEMISRERLNLIPWTPFCEDHAH